MITVLYRLTIERTYLNMMKAVYLKPIPKISLNKKKLNHDKVANYFSDPFTTDNT